MNLLRSRTAGAVLMILTALCCARGEEVLRDVASIRSLPRERAVQRLPVEIQGVVFFSYYLPDSDFFVFDGHQGIYVHMRYAVDSGMLKPHKNQPRTMKPGMLVKVQGVTGVGDYAPDIYPNRIELIGTEALPKYAAVTMTDLQTGCFDGQPVLMRGVVQRVESSTGIFGARLLVALEGGGHISCPCVHFKRSEATCLVDSVVQLQGVACTYFNRRAQAVGVRLQLNSENDVTILDPSSSDPFAAPLVSIRNLLIFSPTPPTLHRERARGTVTFSQPGKYFYIQDGDEAVRVTTRQADALAPGDVVEVSGFPEMTQYYVEIHEAAFRKIDHASAPAPVSINGENALKAIEPRVGLENMDLEGRLVQISGELERIDFHAIDGPLIYLLDGDRTFTAQLTPDVTPDKAADWKPGSRLVIAGVCVMELSAAWPALDYPRPVDFRVLTRSAADITLVRPAPWWTTRRVVIAFISADVVIVLACGLIWFLRRKAITPSGAKA